jgi:hypothetical protein
MQTNVDSHASHPTSDDDTRKPYLRPTVEELDVGATQGKPVTSIPEGTTFIGS